MNMSNISRFAVDSRMLHEGKARLAEAGISTYSLMKVHFS